MAQANARGVEDRVGDRRGKRAGSSLAGADSGLIAAFDELDDDIGDLGKAQNRIKRPIETRYLRSIKFYCFF